MIILHICVYAYSGAYSYPSKLPLTNKLLSINKPIIINQRVKFMFKTVLINSPIMSIMSLILLLFPNYMYIIH